MRWPRPAVATVLALTNEYVASHRERAREGDTFFEQRAQEVPKSALFIAVSGMLQARLAPSVPADQPAAWIAAALAKLDQAVVAGGGLER